MLYVRLFAEHEPVLLLGRHRDSLAGYALGYTMPVTGSRLADTWASGAQVAEVESLSVLPEYRGRGLGSVLLEQLHDRLRQQGANDFILGALAGNTDAIRLYERHGYGPKWLYSSRLDQRARSGGDDVALPSAQLLVGRNPHVKSADAGNEPHPMLPSQLRRRPCHMSACHHVLMT